MEGPGSSNVRSASPSLICIAHASLAVGSTPPLSNAAASETYVTRIPDWLTQLLQLDDTLPTLAAGPDTIAMQPRRSPRRLK